LTTLRSLEEENKRLGVSRDQKLQELELQVVGAISRLRPQARLAGEELEEEEEGKQDESGTGSGQRTHFNPNRAIEGNSMTVQDVIGLIQTLQPVDDDSMARLSENMKDLSVKISTLVDESKSMASDQTVLKSLRFRSMKIRHANIVDAHSKTFEWIFELPAPISSSPSPSSPGFPSQPSFFKWLRTQSGIYWIMGKAGSGKSTLMKFLCDHERTRKALLSWSSMKHKKLVTAQFFFWNAGTAMQKSQEGLLQSLLYEVFRQCPELIRIVCPMKWGSTTSEEHEMDPWSRSELLEACNLLLQQKEVPARFCFFVDGLDEYDGDHAELVRVLELFPISPDIKLCVSSRPWYVFKDAFGHDSDRKLALEDLTRTDIEIYVRNKFKENVRFKHVMSNPDRDRYQELIQEIVEKAEGVFLWVFLVVRSLLSGLTNADKISDLQRRLRLLPPTLEAYFRHMIDSVEDIYQEQTAQTFQVALEAVEPLSLITYSYLDEDDPDCGIHAEIQPLTVEEVQSRQEDMRRRIDGRCKGLLEIPRYTSSPLHPFFRFKVTFLHRTVRDFLLTRDMQKMLTELIKHEFNAKASICKAFLAQMKSVPWTSRYEQTHLDLLLEDTLYYARQIELQLELPQTRLLDEVAQVLLSHPIRAQSRKEHHHFLALAVEGDLQLYVARKLEEIPDIEGIPGRPLLDHALHPAKSKYRTRFVSSEMVELLLRNGASPNQTYEESTVWCNFLRSLSKSTAKFDQSSTTEVLDVIEMLLIHGANPKQAVLVGFEPKSHEATSGWTSLFTGASEQSPVHKTARVIISDLFGPYESTRLFGKPANKQATGAFGWLGWPFG
jgi:hypothetical protein